MRIENNARKYIAKQQITFFCLLLKVKTIVLAIPLAYIRAHTMLQQLQNLASDDTIHGYQTCPLLELFSKNRCLNRCNVLFAESRVEYCLELNFRYVDYQPLAVLQFLYLL